MDEANEDGVDEIIDMNVTKKGKGKGKVAPTIADNTSANLDAQSATLMSTHAMKMGLYTINLGSERGQRLHTCHLIILPLIPVFILKPELLHLRLQPQEHQ